MRQILAVGHAFDVWLRDAKLDDLRAIIDVQEAGAVRALAHIFPQEAYPFPREEIRTRWAAEIASPDVRVLVIEGSDGYVVGFAAIRENELLHFGMATDTWGTGLAATAHSQLLERFSVVGVTRARLRVFEDNHRARRFYEKQGWRQTWRRSRTSFPPHPVLIEYERGL